MVSEHRSNVAHHRGVLPSALLVLLPLAAFFGLMLWFSEYRIVPNPSVEASSSNPLGFLVSNFVYDGPVNVENVLASFCFLGIVFLYYPRVLRLFSAYLLPVFAVAVAATAELTAISTKAVGPQICGGGCSFYGMSGVSNAIVGFTLASFFVALGLAISKSRTTAKERGARDPIILGLALVAYVVILLALAGVIALPASHGESSSGGSGGPPTPPPIFTQTPPSWVVHSASLAYGFVIAVAVFVLLNRRYGLIAPRRRTLPVG